MDVNHGKPDGVDYGMKSSLPKPKRDLTETNAKLAKIYLSRKVLYWTTCQAKKLKKGMMIYRVIGGKGYEFRFAGNQDPRLIKLQKKMDTLKKQMAELMKVQKGA